MGGAQRSSGACPDRGAARWGVGRQAARQAGCGLQELPHSCWHAGSTGAKHTWPQEHQAPLPAPHPDPTGRLTPTEKGLGAGLALMMGTCCLSLPATLDGVPEAPGCIHAPGSTPWLQNPQKAPHSLTGLSPVWLGVRQTARHLCPPVAGPCHPQHGDRTPLVLGSLCPAQASTQGAAGHPQQTPNKHHSPRENRRGRWLALPKAPPQATAAQTEQEVILTRAREGQSRWAPPAEPLLCTCLEAKDTDKGPQHPGQGDSTGEGGDDAGGRAQGGVIAPLEAIFLKFHCTHGEGQGAAEGPQGGHSPAGGRMRPAMAPPWCSGQAWAGSLGRHGLGPWGHREAGSKGPRAPEQPGKERWLQELEGLLPNTGEPVLYQGSGSAQED